MMKHRKINQEGVLRVTMKGLKMRTVLKAVRNHSLFLIKQLLPGFIFALLCLYFYPLSLTSYPRTELHHSSHIITCISSISSGSPPLPELPSTETELSVSYQITNHSTLSGSPTEPDISLTPSTPPVIVLPHSNNNTNYSSVSESPPLLLTLSPPTELPLPLIITNNSFIPASTPSPPPTPPPSYSGILLSEKDKDLPPPPPLYSVKGKVYEKQCDYFNGKWVREKKGPLYNGTTCGVIKESHNCMANGRPDSEYLYWKWKPRRCHLPRFNPEAFLQLIRNKHVSFVGDSLARNQLESLICMLSTFETPKFIYRGIGWWYFPSYNATLSSYWAPFLVQGVQRQLRGPGPRHNTMHLDQVNENWAKDVGEMDFIVLAFGNWFVEVPSIYHEGDSVLGCLNLHRPNCTEIGYYVPIRKALRTALNSIIERKTVKGDGIGVIVRTFAPVHFEGSWDKGGTCSRLTPYRGKRKLGKNDAEIRRIGLEEMQKAKDKAKYFGRYFKIKALDVTKLSLMRPDGHPGAYVSPNAFSKGVTKVVHNDCTHWCLPGPIDTWNEIFMEMVKKWEQ
ncbi:xyloglucan O-acetyltransferase 1-like isoform X2 [Lotus japonicus]|uniref:xyloglucan O-acetyltransferase 1-like isoform X2 n=1 Tax=Lotus japonicus TaxID=34305 RepID=UPI00258DE7C6|nr:xyloglucan O-acetyltransferase 1-like isoform X2 [Lotus japonicus]